jgi:site-specific DNA-methyltransferase (adenine-specific)
MTTPTTVEPPESRRLLDRLVGQPLPLDSIICGDNCDVLGMFPRDCIDLVVTSPPYDDLRTYGGHSWDFYGVAWQLKRVLKPGGVIVWVVGDATKDGSETGTSMRQALHFQQIGLRLHDTMIYATNKPPMNDRRYQQCWEFSFVLSKGSPSVCNLLTERCRFAGTPTAARYRQDDGELKDRHGPGVIGETKPRENIWWLASGNGKQDKVSHPAPFPFGLARDHVLTWSNDSDIVLDPFNGSGTTTKAARETGRRFIGIDVNESYCEIARKRLAQKLLEFDAAG